MSVLRFEPGPGEDPCAIFFKGFSSSVKPAEVSDYFYNKGYHNRITYQKFYAQHFRLFMALRFDNMETAKEVCEKYANTILFGYKIHLSFFKKNVARFSSPFMQDKLRKLRAQAIRRPFFFNRNWVHGHYSPARSFKPRSRRRSRSSSSDSDRSVSPERKRRDRSRDGPDTKRRRHRSHSHSRSSRSTSRSETPTRFSPSSSSTSKQSSNDKSSDHVRKVCSKVTVVENNQTKKFSDGSRSSKERSQELSPPAKGKQSTQSPNSNKERFMTNFSPVSFGSDDDAMLMTPTPEPTTGRDAPTGGDQKDQSVSSYFAPRKGSQSTEAWIRSEGDSTPDGGTPSPRGPGPLSRGPTQSKKQSHSVYGRVGSFTEIKAMDRPWQLKPLTVQDSTASSATNKQTEFVIGSPTNRNSTGVPHSHENGQAGSRVVVQANGSEATYIESPSAAVPPHRQPSLSSPTRSQIHPNSHEGAWSPGSSRLQSPTSSFGASPPKVNGVRKGEVHQSKLEKLQTKKEEIIRAYKQDCDTFATVVQMLIRKDPELEQRLQQALRENLTEIGQRCVQELQEVVEQIKD